MKIDETIKRTVTATLETGEGYSVKLTELDGTVSITSVDSAWCTIRTADLLAYADAVRGKPVAPKGQAFVRERTREAAE